MDHIDAAGAASVMAKIAAVIEENKDRLTALDQAIGDGDMGVVLAAGFAAAAGEAAACGEKEPGRVFMKAGIAINRHAPSTMGTLMSTGFMRGGKAVAGKPELTPGDMAAFFQAFLDGVMERGRAKPGDKTLIDAMVPAIDALKGCGGTMPAALAAAFAGAEKGAEAARGLMSRHGRPGIFREKTIGMEDPGAAAACLVFKAFAEAAAEN